MLKLMPVVLLTALAACGDGLTPPPVDAIADITVEPATVYVLPGDTVQLRAVARRPNGEEISGLAFDWSSSAPAKLEMLDDGRAVGVAVGDGTPQPVTITARAGTVEGIATANVCAHSTMTMGSRFKLYMWSGFSQNGAVLDGDTLLFGGGLIYGTGADDLIVGSSPSGTIGSRISPSMVCRIMLPEAQYSRSIIRTREVPSSVMAEQESYAVYGEARSRLVLLRYTFTNITDKPVSGLRVAMHLDWDLLRDNTSIEDDRSRFIAALSAIAVTDPSGTTAGIATIDAPIVSFTIHNRYSTATPRTRADLFASLAGGIVEDTSEDGDRSDVVAFAPLNIPVGESRSVTFALIGAENYEEFEASVKVASEIADAFPRKLQSQ